MRPTAQSNLYVLTVRKVIHLHYCGYLYCTGVGKVWDKNSTHAKANQFFSWKIWSTKKNLTTWTAKMISSFLKVRGRVNPLNFPWCATTQDISAEGTAHHKQRLVKGKKSFVLLYLEIPRLNVSLYKRKYLKWSENSYPRIFGAAVHKRMTM